MSIPWPLVCRQWQGARPYQEDAFGTLEVDTAGETPALLMILADGMGGAAGGATASSTVVDVFTREFPISSGNTDVRFRQCLEATTVSLSEQETDDPRLKGMGSTVVAALYDGHRIEWLSVGDSPMWLFTNGTLVRLNADHSMVPVLQRLVGAGKLSPEKARGDWRRNMLRSAVTGSAAEMVDCAYRACRLQSDDFLVIASDGLETLSEEEIARELRAASGNAEAAANALFSAVRAASGPSQDNVTFLLLSAGPDPKDRATT